MEPRFQVSNSSRCFKVNILTNFHLDPKNVALVLTVRETDGHWTKVDHYILTKHDKKPQIRVMIECQSTDQKV